MPERTLRSPWPSARVSPTTRIEHSDPDSLRADLDGRLQSIKLSVDYLHAKRGDRRVIDPVSRGHVAWSVVVVVLAVYSIIATGYHIAFPAAYLRALFIDYLVDIVFVVHLVLNVRLVGRREGAVLVQPSARRYALSVSGVCDACACLPLDLFQATQGWNPAWRVLKLLRLSSIRSSLNTLQRATTREPQIDAVHVTRLALTWLLLPQLAAVGRILLARHSPADDNDDAWGPSAAVVAQPDHVQYLAALYWAMGTMSGYADGSLPWTALQHLFTLLLLNCGVILLAYTVGALALLGGSTRQRAHAFERLVSSLRHLIGRHPEFPEELTRRLTSHVLHRWETIKTHQTGLADAAQLLSELPVCIRNEAVQCMTADALSKVPLFANSEPGFMFALTQRMEAIEVLMNEDIVIAGALNDCMYVVLRGVRCSAARSPLPGH